MCRIYVDLSDRLLPSSNKNSIKEKGYYCLVENVTSWGVNSWNLLQPTNSKFSCIWPQPRLADPTLSILGRLITDKILGKDTLICSTERNRKKLWPQKHTKPLEQLAVQLLQSPHSSARLYLLQDTAKRQSKHPTQMNRELKKGVFYSSSFIWLILLFDEWILISDTGSKSSHAWASCR